jgi:hypothetical protein
MAKRGGKRRDPARERFWRRTIRDQQRSGLSVRDYCKREGLKDGAFRWWRQELPRRDRKASVNPSGSLAFPSVCHYNGRHACGAFSDFLARCHTGLSPAPARGDSDLLGSSHPPSTMPGLSPAGPGVRALASGGLLADAASAGRPTRATPPTGKRATPRPHPLPRTTAVWTQGRDLDHLQRSGPTAPNASTTRTTSGKARTQTPGLLAPARHRTSRGTIGRTATLSRLRCAVGLVPWHR